ncbi:MAG TPA: hypothetical protein VG078_11060, partial [Acidimicrobiales bacterium]|nr:hypothetical protein [Acidimicrobiales bacterium]
MAAVAALALLLGGCGGGDGDEALPPPPSIAEPTTVPADPYAVPAVIDAAYVNRVLEGLDAAMSDVVRLVIRSRDLPPEAVERLEAIYAEPGVLRLRQNLIQQDLNKQLEGYRENPGNQKTT